MIESTEDSEVLTADIIAVPEVRFSIGKLPNFHGYDLRSQLTGQAVRQRLVPW